MSLGNGRSIEELLGGIEHEADIVLHPDVAEFGLLAW